MKHSKEMEKKGKKRKGSKKNPKMPMKKAGKAKCAMEMGMGSKAK